MRSSDGPSEAWNGSAMRVLFRRTGCSLIQVYLFTIEGHFQENQAVHFDHAQSSSSSHWKTNWAAVSSGLRTPKACESGPHCEVWILATSCPDVT